MATLTKRTTTDLDWPDRLFGRRLLDWPESLANLFDDSVLRVEEFEEDGAKVVRAEMPGIDPDKDVEITVTDGILRIKAERTEESRTEDKKRFRSEFRYGSFQRSLPLPVGATEEDIKATYTDGILEVRIPINDKQAEAKKIPVARR